MKYVACQGKLHHLDSFHTGGTHAVSGPCPSCLIADLKAKLEKAEIEAGKLRAEVATTNFHGELAMKAMEEAIAERDKLREKQETTLAVLEGMAEQFAYWAEGKRPGYCTGGLSALEAAFDVLGWSDPNPAPQATCQFQGCKKQTTCGTPTPTGYKHLCGNHFSAALEKPYQKS